MAQTHNTTVSKEAPEKNKTSAGSVDARPQGQGVDPLADGKRLHNVPNTSEASTYKASNNKQEFGEQ